MASVRYTKTALRMIAVFGGALVEPCQFMRMTFALLLLLGCTPAVDNRAAADVAGAPAAPGNGDVHPRAAEAVRLGQALNLGRVTVTPLALIENSRCPEDRACVWAGRVVVRVRVAAGGTTQEVDAILGELQSVAGTSFMLTDALAFAVPGRNPPTYELRYLFDAPAR